MNKKIPIIIFVTILLAGCTSSGSSSSSLTLPITGRDFDIGIAGFVPSNYPNSTSSDWQDFFSTVPQLGELFGVYVAWDSTSLDEQLSIASSQLGALTPVVAIGYPLSSVTGPSYFASNKDAYKQAVLDAVEHYDIDYLAIGVEVNSLYAKVSPETFNAFVEFYKEVYDAVKAVSPATKVFTIFQLEMMKGQAKLMGLNLSAEWDLISSFGGKMDLVGFTTYPFLEYDSVEAMPEDYYTSINQYVDVPVAFTEMGWPTDLPLVAGGEQEQVDFLLKIVNATKSLDVELMLYPFLHDGAFTPYIFDSVGLKYSNGTAKEAYSYWLALKKLT